MRNQPHLLVIGTGFNFGYLVVSFVALFLLLDETLEIFNCNENLYLLNFICKTSLWLTIIEGFWFDKAVSENHAGYLSVIGSLVFSTL